MLRGSNVLFYHNEGADPEPATIRRGPTLDEDGIPVSGSPATVLVRTERGERQWPTGVLWRHDPRRQGSQRDCDQASWDFLYGGKDRDGGAGTQLAKLAEKVHVLERESKKVQESHEALYKMLSALQEQIKPSKRG